MAITLGCCFLVFMVIPGFRGQRVVDPKQQIANKQATSNRNGIIRRFPLPLPAVEGFSDFEVESVEIVEQNVCSVSFRHLPPTAEIAEKIVRNAMDEAVRIDANKDAFVAAFYPDDAAMPDYQYSGPFVYRASDRRILSMNEVNGTIVREVDEGTYFARIEERTQTYRDNRPEKKWFDLFIVFADRPSNEEATIAVITELEKMKVRQRDVTVSILAGVKTNRITWEQIEGLNGKPMTAEYKTSTGDISANWKWDDTAAPVAKNEPRPPKEVVKPPIDPEFTPNQLLRSAQLLINVGKKPEARERLEKIIDKYPESKAAKEAANLLKDL